MVQRFCSASGDTRLTFRWSGAIFGTTSGAGGGGLTSWQLVREVPAGAPLVMTTTPDKRLFAFSCTGGRPMLCYALDPNNPLSTVGPGIDLGLVSPTGAPPCVGDPNRQIARQQT